MFLLTVYFAYLVISHQFYVPDLVQTGVTFQPFSHPRDSVRKFLSSCFSLASFAFAAFVCSVF